MNIPDKALEAAVEAITNRANWHDPADAVFDAQAAIEAAAPFIAAQAVWDAASKINTHQFGPAAAPYLSAIKAQLKADAGEIEGQK